MENLALGIAKAPRLKARRTEKLSRAGQAACGYVLTKAAIGADPSRFSTCVANLAEEAMQLTRPAAVAGLFYPADKHQLQSMIHSYLDHTTPSGGMPKAIIAPHAGYIYIPALSRPAPMPGSAKGAGALAA
jgi:hypothetical protein